MKHGGYSLMVKSGELPERRSYLRAYLTEVREGLILDLGPTEEDLTTAQRVILDRAISKLCLIRCIEEFIKEQGVFKGIELSPVLAQSYLSYCESLERSFRTLGIDKRKSNELLTPLEVAAEIDKSKAEGRTTGAAAIVDPGAFEREIKGEDINEENHDSAGPVETLTADAGVD
jgi:hypothetical protein